MSMTLSENLVRRIDECAVCHSRALESVIEMPLLPLTGLYAPLPPSDPPIRHDQELLICMDCGHGQTRFQIVPDVQYSSDYSFRTSTSATAKRGTDFFVSCLRKLAPLDQFESVLDIGCNDLYLLRQFENSASIRVGVDPIWQGRENENDDPSITVLGDMIENIDLSRLLVKPPDLIVCRHTLEHVAEPRYALQRLIDLAADNALFLIETPGLDSMIYRLRFDQVFHQHLQYFNLASFMRLIHEVGAEYEGSFENYHDWGALLVAFRKSDYANPLHQPISQCFNVAEIRSRYQIFKKLLHTVNEILGSIHDVDIIYGYGAAQMLPVLAYHLGSGLENLTAILDDNQALDGWYYQNLKPQIRCPSASTELNAAAVLVTAIDNVEPIMNKLLSKRPKHILLPLNLF